MSVRAHLSTVTTALLDFVWPPRCPVCEAWQDPNDRQPLCHHCTACLVPPAGERCRRCSAPVDIARAASSSCPNCEHWPEPHFDQALVLTEYSATAHDAIHALKFSGNKQIGRFLGEQIGHCLGADLGGIDLLVPVPLHGARQRDRGYNQAEEIARGLGKALGVPTDCSCLRRVRPTRQQAQLDSKQRVANVAGAFSMRRKLAGEHAHIGLIDDVLTTGATLSACAAALRSVTRAKITAIAVASPFSDQHRMSRKQAA